MGLEEIGSVLSILQKSKPARKSPKKLTKAAPLPLPDHHPIVKIIQAGQGIYKFGDTLTKVNGAAGNLETFVPEAADALQELASKAGDVADIIQEFIPSMQILGQSVCDSAKIFSSFSGIATTVGIGANIILTFQGVQALELIGTRLQDISTQLAAQTALQAQKEFPGYVYKMIQQRLGETVDDGLCDHWFFMYHPDNDWYPEFYHLLEKAPLGPRFCGYTNQIDTVFVFMLSARRQYREKEKRAQRAGKPIRPVKIHLLIPAYQPILIPEALEIPKELGDFVMEGRINSNKHLVWFNLPKEQKHYVLDIGSWVPPPRTWSDWAMTSMGLMKDSAGLTQRRVLGERQGQGKVDEGQIEHPEVNDGNDDDPAPTADHSPSRKQHRSHATALEKRPKKHSRRKGS